MTRVLLGVVLVASVAACGGAEPPVVPQAGYVGTPTPTPAKFARVGGVASDGTPEPTPTPTLTPTPAIKESTPEPYSPPAPTRAEVRQPAPSGDLYSLIQQVFPEWAWGTAYRIALCESNGNPNATGAAGERGWFQLHPVHGALSTYDPWGNVQGAFIISSGGTDWSAWTCS